MAGAPDRRILGAGRRAPAGHHQLVGPDCICLVGRNGAGESTLLEALAGLVELDGDERLERARPANLLVLDEPINDLDMNTLDLSR